MGLSTIGNISFGIAFVWGKNRVPKPAAGITAFLILPIMQPSFLIKVLKRALKFFKLQALLIPRVSVQNASWQF
jgi:hypothetical protein